MTTTQLMDLGDGRVALDSGAVEALKRQPEDADGCIDENMRMWLQGNSFDVTPA